MGSSVVSHYEILEKAGEGGCGTLYRARDLHVPRFVALKFIHPHLLGSERAVRRFQEEAKAVSSLSHPNIVVLHDFDTDPETGRIFLVLEYLEGGTLRELIRQSNQRGLPLDPFELCRCAAAAAAGLGHAHRRGITHRDVKSSNVMFTGERIVKITDFGLATAGAGLDLTEPGCTPGTLSYMSPEQARGLDLDHRTDIFSLGLVLYEMAAGRLPFPASSSYELLQKIVTEPTPSLKQARGDLPEELDRIIQRATAKEPAERYQRIEELETELLAVQDRLKRLSDEPTKLIAPLPRAPSSRRRPVAAAALLALLALVALGAFFFFRTGRPPPGTPAPASRMLAVIPFDCLGKDDSHKAFCEGLAHTLSMKLTQIEAFQDDMVVVPYSEVRREGIRSAAEANRVLKVSLAVTGSVEFIDQNVRVIVNLVDAEKKIQTASRKLDSATGRLTQLRDETSVLAANMLELRLTPASRRQLDAGQTHNEAAFHVFLLGLGYLSRTNEITDVRRATELLEEAVTLDPSYALAYTYLGEAYLRQYDKTADGRWMDRARESCERALRINDRLGQAHVALAEVWLARTAPEKAIEELKVALRIEPKSADALRVLGNAYADLGVRQRDPARKQLAIDTFQEAIALRPELWTTYRDLGLAYYRMGDKSKAEEQFRRMLQFTESADAYRNLGALYHLMGRPEEAIVCLKKSIAIRPTPEAYANLGTVYYYLKRYAEVIPNDENALRLSAETRTRNYVIWGNLAMACLGTPGMEARGRQAFQEAIRIAQAKLRASPKDGDTHASLGYYLVRTGDDADALRHCQQAMQLAPDVASVLFRCALVYERLKRRDQALATLLRAIQKGHPMLEVLNAGDLAPLRGDPRFQQYLKSSR